MSVRQNVDVDKLNGFRDFLSKNPNKGRLRLQARAVYEGQAGRSTVHIGPYGLDDQDIDRETRHYTMPFGAWREVEEIIGHAGPTDRFEPVEVVLAAEATCIMNAISYNTARLGIDTSQIEITVSTTVDPRVLFALKGPDEHTSCLGTVEYEVKVGGDVSEEDLETIRRLCAHSPVHGMLVESIEVKGRVSRADAFEPVPA